MNSKQALTVTTFAFLFSLCHASIPLQEVVTNTEKEGLHILDQGYKGKLKHLEGSHMVDGEAEKEIEFSHAFLNDRGLAKRFSPTQSIAIGLGGESNQSYRARTPHIKNLPKGRALMKLNTIEEFEQIFGKSRNPSSGWSFRGIDHSSESWLAFTLQKDGAIRVVSVILRTISEDGKPWRIDNKTIKEGIFSATGKSPNLEDR